MIDGLVKKGLPRTWISLIAFVALLVFFYLIEREHSSSIDGLLKDASPIFREVANAMHGHQVLALLVICFVCVLVFAGYVVRLMFDHKNKKIR